MRDNIRNFYELETEKILSKKINISEEFLINMNSEKNVREKRKKILGYLLRDTTIEVDKVYYSNILKNMNDEDNYFSNKLYKKNIQYLREYVKVTSQMIKEFGEVMTPIELVEEMLDTLPIEVQSNPNLKQLDPANGVGTFISVVYDRLMDGLIDFEPDAKKRSKHIQENMIYVCELQTQNMFLYLCAFDPYDTEFLNIHLGSYLDEDFDDKMKYVQNIDKFDIILGNPPYQEISHSKTKTSNNSRVKLQMKFIDKSIGVNNKSLCDYLLFVTPNNQLSDTCYLNKIFNDFLVYGEINTDNLKKKYFSNINSTFSYYLLSTSNKNKGVLYSNGVKLNDCKIMPKNNTSNISISIFNKVIKDKKDIFKRIDGNRDNDLITNKITSNNVYYISRSKHDGFKKYNIINFDISDTSIYYIETNLDSDKVLNILNSKLYKYLIQNLKSGRAITSSINYLPDINELIDVVDLYVYYNLTKEEIELIESSIK